MALGELPHGPAKRRAVRTMFDRIAPRYDRLNRVLTAGLDRRWREAAVETARVAARDRVVDLACGTGDLAAMAAARGAAVVALDFAPRMLHAARRRGIPAALVQADAVALPMRDASASVVLCGFALRNFVSIPEVLREAARVLEPGGRIALLEVGWRGSALARLAEAVYFGGVVPRLGAWLSDSEAYAYLPRSAAYLPSEEGLRRWLQEAGFARLHARRLLGGAVRILSGVRS